MNKHMYFSANDKMIEHTIFWENVWNGISIGLLLATAWLVKELFSSIGTMFQLF
jgi:hypothetical protein